MIEPNDYSSMQWLLGYLRGSAMLICGKHQDDVLEILQQLDILIDKYKPNANQN